jgi:hypothetical protein
VQSITRIAARQTRVRDAKLRIFPNSAYLRVCGYPHTRKGWLFADTVGGAAASANLYSLIETCKANGVDPYIYLVELLRALPLATTADDYEALLPWKIFLAANR